MFNWKCGLYRLFQNDTISLDFPDGVLLDVVPSQASLDSIIGVQRVLYMMQNYSGRFSFEIWKDQKFSFHIFSSARAAEGMLRSQLRSIYPQCEVRLSKTNLPSICEGEFVSACSLALYGKELNLRCPEDFRYDPLRHLLEAMNAHGTKTMVQVLFERMGKLSKKKRIVLAQKYGNDLGPDVKIPVLKCLIRITSFAQGGYKAWENCGHIARTFSVFDSERSRLVPKIVFYPLVRNSFFQLKSISRRAFHFLSKSFMASVPELVSFVHLPVGAENCGVCYAEPSLSKW